jgi:putative protease
MTKPVLVPELLLPAGGFDAAIAAIDGGADALYLGFSEFSARKGARNFDRLEYRRLHGFARRKGVRLYVALNTILLPAELERAAELLAFLGRFPPDAVLVQDWGLAALVRDRHPGIAIHASTQAAVQGVCAARIARELGATRIVLPRETSLDEMHRLREEEPGIEYEAFVHGALCFSFSGLCLASGLVLGRSGNRGECAQLCRSYYDDGGKNGYWFSCRDLDLGDRVGDLAAAGICSLKVEGRMKSPEYCYAVARLYRGLLDRLTGDGPDEAEIEARRAAARTAFSRSPTEGWLRDKGGASLIDSAYPGHRGVVAGRIAQVLGDRITLDLSSDLGLRDGLLGFERGDQSRPWRFPVLELRDSCSGRDLVRARSGARVEMGIRLEEGHAPDFRVGDELYRISAREFDLRTRSPEEYEIAREELSLKLKIGMEGMSAELELPSFDGRRGARPRIGEATRSTIAIEAGAALPLDRARSAGGFERALALFKEAGDADFRLLPTIDLDVAVALPPSPNENPRLCAISELFLPPSVLKKEKNRMYSCAARLIAEAEAAYARESIASLAGTSHPQDDPEPTPQPPRAALVFPRENLSSGMPFANRRDLLAKTDFPSWGGRSWLPLAPLVADRDEYATLVGDRVDAALGKGSALIVGLGALHHFGIARDLLKKHHGAGDDLAFFLDFNLYVANASAYAALSSLLPKIEFAYRYIEPVDQAEIGASLAPIGSGFEAPLFQSLGCFLKQNVLGGACPVDCARAWSSTLADRDRRYRVIVEDCVTFFFRAPAKEKPSI